MNLTPNVASWSIGKLHAGQRAMLMLVFFVGAWAVVEAVFGVRLQQHYNLMQIVWCRYAAHLTLMLLVWGWRQPSLLWRTRRPVFQLSRSMLMLVMPLSFAMALQFGDRAGTVWALFWVSPLLILGLARWLIGELVPPWLWAAAAVGEVAAAIMLAPVLPQTLAGVLLPLLMALSFSLYVVMTRLLRGEAVQANLFYTGFGVFVVLSFFMPHVWITPSLHDTALLAGIGALGFLALLALDRACERAPVSRVAPALHTHLLCISMIEWISSGEHPSGRALFAALAIGLIAIGLWVRQPALEQTYAAPP